jgi:predicted Fe-S protein YdhL (DUF1289 family)
MPVPSPCIGLCRLDEKDTCLGCGRTLAEIAEWTSCSTARKQTIVSIASARMAGTPVQIGSEA